MWRAFFLALGAYVFILGAECLAIDKAVLKNRDQASGGAFRAGADAGRMREFVPTDWAPWSLMSSGAVTLLYSFTLPRRAKG